MSKIALFPGSFDPFTNGHFDIVLRANKIFDKIIIAIGHNTQKSRYFDVNHMKSCIDRTFEDYHNISTIIYDELTAKLAQSLDAKFIIRGLRNTTDFEFENSVAHINQSLNNELETIFLITSPKYAPISSTIVREVHKYKGDISAYIPYKL